MLHCYCEDRYNGYVVLSLVVWKEIMNLMRLTVLNIFIPKIKKEVQRNLTNTCVYEIIFFKKYTIF